MIMENENILTIEKVDWIVKYLQGKDVTLNDLKTFFKIQNGEFEETKGKKRKKVKIEQINDLHYNYEIENVVFNVILEKIPDLKITYIIKDVYCLKGE